MYRELYESYQSIYGIDEARVDDRLEKPIQKSDARTERSGGDEPARMLKHFLGRSIKKKKGIKEGYNTVVDYLLDEGYTDSSEKADIIIANMTPEWFESILEGLSKLTDMKPSEIKSQRQSLEGQWKELVNQVMKTKDPQEKARLAAKAKNIKAKIDAAKKEEGFHKSIVTKDSGDSDLTPEQEANKKRVQKATYGSTPQTPKYGEKAAPLRPTAAQRAAERVADREVGYMDPTYYNRSTGQRERINAAGPTELNYGGRGKKRITPYYQQGATGSGERGPTPAGSTIDPSRRRLRGPGRSLNQ